MAAPLVTDTNGERDQIAVCYAQNIWVVPRAGGVVRPRHQFPGTTPIHIFRPTENGRLSRRVRRQFSTSYLVARMAASQARLTWHPGVDLVQG